MGALKKETKSAGHTRKEDNLNLVSNDTALPTGNFSPSATLHLTNSENEKWHFKIQNKTQHILGREPASSFLIMSDAISRSHLSFFLDTDRGVLILKDLKSTNGTRINGEAMIPNREYLIDKNVRISIGARIKGSIQFDELKQNSVTNSTKQFKLILNESEFISQLNNQAKTLISFQITDRKRIVELYGEPVFKEAKILLKKKFDAHFLRHGPVYHDGLTAYAITTQPPESFTNEIATFKNDCSLISLDTKKIKVRMAFDLGIKPINSLPMVQSAEQLKALKEMLFEYDELQY